ncbi:MAG: hypothetical protein JO159_14065 [Acidobacteria bacterium]|nr:hypothetical protein [Acidobacteriota bacterium]
MRGPALPGNLFQAVAVRIPGVWSWFGASLACMVALGAVPGVAQSKDQVAPTLGSAQPAFTAFAPASPNFLDARALDSKNRVAIDSIRTFSGGFQAAGVDPYGRPQHEWYYTMGGGLPQLGGTTVFDAPIVPVSLDLLDYDGSLRVVNGHPLHASVKPFVNAVVNSPVFETADYSSSDVPTQFSDAVLRAEFYNLMKPDWHTLLRPSVKSERTLSVPRGKYFFALNRDGSCCAFVLVDIKAFLSAFLPQSPSDVKSPVGGAEHARAITSKALSTFLFPNTYLYRSDNPNHCCVLGFHTYDFEPGDVTNGFREKRYVLNFSSWISPGIFAPGFEDISALSHELTESLDNPFVGSDGVHGITPWWQAPNGHCQDDLETGDVLEGLPEATTAIRTRGRTYHPQTEALLEWFAFESPSSALAASYSYPNQNVLTALSPPEAVNCR